MASLHARFANGPATAQPLPSTTQIVAALIATGDFRLQRLLTELLFRGSAPPPGSLPPGPVRLAVAGQLHEHSPAAATAFAALRPAHFEADCRAFLVQLNRAVGLVQSVQAEGVWFNGQPLGAPILAAAAGATPSAPAPGPSSSSVPRRGKAAAAAAAAPPPGRFWIDFNAHCISFDARLPDEDDHDLVEVPYTKMTEFDFVAPPSATADARWADGASGNVRCLRLMLSSAPTILGAYGGQGRTGPKRGLGRARLMGR